MKRPTLILLCGIPGSGKSTYAAKYVQDHTNTIHLSSDKIREELWGNEATQGDNNEVFNLMQSRAIEALNNGHSVVYDATNVTRKDRAGIISVCPKFVKIECHIIWAPIETCIERDATRERTVGKAVIDKILKRFQAPYYDEGIVEIKVIRPNGFDSGLYLWDVCDAMRIPHDNPHHTLNIYEHCCKAYDYALGYGKDDAGIVALAAMIHDSGKPYSKVFVDSKGNPCETAHYFQHQCISAWISYGLSGDAVIDIAWLCSVHMDPFFNTKYYKQLPTYLKRQIDLFHEADLAAH
jgi:predicted kinase